MQADVFLTGEMSHHAVLAAVQTGTSVILTDHTNTERGSGAGRAGGDGARPPQEKPDTSLAQCCLPVESREE